MATNIPINAPSPLLPAGSIELRHGLHALPRALAIGAWSTIALGAVAFLLLAGDDLLAQGQRIAAWWWQRPEGLVVATVASLTALSALLAAGERRAEADKPVYDIR